MKAILHCDKNWGIGKNNNLMFRLAKDMAFFRRTTKGKTVVMGTNTLLSLPGEKPLKDRMNIVLSSSLETLPTLKNSRLYYQESTMMRST